MAVNAYINFRGNCREAVTYYADVFQTEPPRFLTYGQQQTGMPLPESMKDLVMHTELSFLGGKVMFSDVPDGRPLTFGDQITLTLTSDDTERLKAIFGKLADGGTVVVDLQETFWSRCYGNVIDRYGIGWQVSQEDAKSAEDCPARQDE